MILNLFIFCFVAMNIFSRRKDLNARLDVKKLEAIIKREFVQKCLPRRGRMHVTAR